MNVFWGSSVSISSNGSIVAVSRHLSQQTNSQDKGHTNIYDFNNTTSEWTQIGDTIIGENLGDNSGYSISLSGDGNIIAIGETLADPNGISSGNTRIFNLNNNTWEQLGDSINGEQTGNKSGWSVSLARDTNTVAIGAINGGSGGTVQIYDYIDL